MSTQPPTPANDPWTELFGASLALEDANDIDEIAATLKDAQRAFPSLWSSRPRLIRSTL